MKTVRLIGPIVLALALLPTGAESTTDRSLAATTDPVSNAFGGGSQLVFENRDSLDRLLRGVTTPQWSMPSRIYSPRVVRITLVVRSNACRNLLAIYLA